ncbi:MAG: indolepyruvate oxidoreductase subunit beta [Coriobacteriales bacterium]|nr:indolepyruvate oxidoreductase subunit beta [Coriobacteriales bacterium]
MSNASTGIVLCGVGGQGTVLATRLIASAAMERGLAVNTAETIGMAQRGGSVFTHVRLGEGVPTPLIGRAKADLIIAFEPAEAVRQLAHLKEGGCVVVANAPIVPVSAMTGGPAYNVDEILGYLRKNVSKLMEVDARKAAEDLGSAKCLNVVLLGAAVRTGMLGLSEQDIAEALERLVPERFLELNRRALRYAKQQ